MNTLGPDIKAWDRDEEEFEDALDRVANLASNYPLPEDLEEAVKDQIEPVTVNLSLKHVDAMEAIETAYPVVLAYLREHPEELTP